MPYCGCMNYLLHATRLISLGNEKKNVFSALLAVLVDHEATDGNVVMHVVISARGIKVDSFSFPSFFLSSPIIPSAFSGYYLDLTFYNMQSHQYSMHCM